MLKYHNYNMELIMEVFIFFMTTIGYVIGDGVTITHPSCNSVEVKSIQSSFFRTCLSLTNDGKLSDGNVFVEYNDQVGRYVMYSNRFFTQFIGTEDKSFENTVQFLQLNDFTLLYEFSCGCSPSCDTVTVTTGGEKYCMDHAGLFSSKVSYRSTDGTALRFNGAKYVFSSRNPYAILNWVYSGDVFDYPDDILKLNTAVIDTAIGAGTVDADISCGCD